MNIRIVSIMASVAMSGCAASGPSFTAKMATMPPLKPDTGRVYVYRTGENMQGSAVALRVMLDGRVFGEVAHRGFQVFDAGAGRHVLDVDAYGSSGSCKISIDVTAAEAHYYKV